MNYTKTRSLLSVLLILACSCSAMAPKNFSQGLALGYTSQTSALQATTTLLQRGQITKKDASIVLEISDQAGKALDSAREMSHAGNMDSAQAQLTLATNILDQVSAYLATRSSSK